jgi:hypothetical protein
MKLPTLSFQLVWIALVAGLIVGAFGGWRVTAWMSQGQKLFAVRTALATERATAQKNIDDLQEQVANLQEASHVYQDELAALRARPVVTEPVRLCIQPGRSRVSQALAAEPRSNAAAASTGILQPGRGANLEAGPDIGPDLRALWRKADEVLAQCRGLQRASPR